MTNSDQICSNVNSSLITRPVPLGATNIRFIGLNKLVGDRVEPAITSWDMDNEQLLHGCN